MIEYRKLLFVLVVSLVAVRGDFHLAYSLKGNSPSWCERQWQAHGAAGPSVPTARERRTDRKRGH